MSPAEIKLVVASPSIKNWPFALGVSVLVTLTGFAVMFIVSLHAAVLILAVGMGILVWPTLHSGTPKFGVTNTRLVGRTGFMTKKESSIPVRGIREIKIIRTPIQKTLGVGNLEAHHPEGTIRFEGIDDPESVRERILAVV